MTIAGHDAYIAAAPEPFRHSLEVSRALLARTLPEAEEIVAYNIRDLTVLGSRPISSLGMRTIQVAALREKRRLGR